MKIQYYLVISLALLSAASFYLINREYPANLSDEGTCAQIYPGGGQYFSYEAIKNICKGQSLTFVVEFEDDKGHRSREIPCLNYKETFGFADIEEFKLISVTQAPC
ncbi:transmembrane protein, putative (macronuclear) [Tetrahymena thermophila SB210]|uniref:Transmembrane protein, putative n=1 Tax=Tetrahymena thermophila (strain SB210) TaxID=312017 RepID=I7MJ67_TETTS|nr:transmembrane protein, putative [Tetrahymena thermophila SB210]EAR96009.1 transmembrane protein, putative [Tetrahymena thermophila SB210]|eukprot:XP_001016254.1 transmembrane protein, putative [Tetrahymena thermophila SB210]